MVPASFVPASSPRLHTQALSYRVLAPGPSFPGALEREGPASTAQKAGCGDTPGDGRWGKLGWRVRSCFFSFLERNVAFLHPCGLLPGSLDRTAEESNDPVRRVRIHKRTITQSEIGG